MKTKTIAPKKERRRDESPERNPPRPSYSSSPAVNDCLQERQGFVRGHCVVGVPSLAVIPTMPMPTMTMTRPNSVKSERRRSSASTRSLSALSYDISDAVDQVRYEEANRKKSIGQRMKTIFSRSILSGATRSTGHPATFRPATIKPIGRTRKLEQWEERSDEQSDAQSSTKSASRKSSLLRQSHQTEPIDLSASTSATSVEMKGASHEDSSGALLLSSSVGACEAQESSLDRDGGRRRTASRRNSRVWQAGTDMMSGHEHIVEGDRHRTTPQHEGVRPGRQCHKFDQLRTSKEEEVRDRYMEDYLESCLEDNLDMMIEFGRQDAAVSLDCCGSLEGSNCHIETSEFCQSSHDRRLTEQADEFDLLMEEYAAMLDESDYSLPEPINEAIPIDDIMLKSFRSSAISDISLNSCGLDTPDS